MTREDTVPKTCPGCVARMLPFRLHARLEVDACRPCALTWFDSGELLRFLSVPSDSVDFAHRTGETRAYGCPRCVDKPLQPISVRRAGTHVLWLCNACTGILIPNDEIARLRASLHARAQHIQHRRAGLAHNGDLSVSRRLARAATQFAAQGRAVMTMPDRPMFLAAVLVFAALVVFTPGVPALFKVYPVLIFHECGHALFSWLSGVPALPTAMGVTFHIGIRVWMVVLAFLCAYAVSTFLFIKAGFRGLAVICAALFCCQFYFSIVVSSQATSKWFLAGGALGECILPALVFLLFPVEMPRRIRWDFWRYVLSVPAGIALVASTRVWIAAGWGKAKLPMGSIVGSDSDGDLSRLKAQFRWSEAFMAHLFMWNSLVCAGLVVAGIAWAVLRERQRRTAPQWRN